MRVAIPAKPVLDLFRPEKTPLGDDPVINIYTVIQSSSFRVEEQPQEAIPLLELECRGQPPAITCSLGPANYAPKRPKLATRIRASRMAICWVRRADCAADI
jgi:hypothetical protein